jgi:outer membrane lipoprotein LolB
MSRLRVVALAVALTVTACATLVQEAQPPRVPEPFDLSGRVSVTYEGQAFSGSLRWQHQAERDEILLLTPLGQARAQIVSSAEGATFTGADGKRYHGASVEALTRQALGWGLPLTHLQYWVRGEAVPGNPSEQVERDAEARLTRLVQDGWQINIVRYPPDQHDGLPRRLELKRNADQTIRLAIDAWRREAAAP